MMILEKRQPFSVRSTSPFLSVSSSQYRHLRRGPRRLLSTALSASSMGPDHERASTSVEAAAPYCFCSLLTQQNSCFRFASANLLHQPPRSRLPDLRVHQALKHAC